VWRRALFSSRSARRPLIVLRRPLNPRPFSTAFFCFFQGNTTFKSFAFIVRPLLFLCCGMGNKIPLMAAPTQAFFFKGPSTSMIMAGSAFSRTLRIPMLRSYRVQRNAKLYLPSFFPSRLSFWNNSKNISFPLIRERSWYSYPALPDFQGILLQLGLTTPAHPPPLLTGGVRPFFMFTSRPPVRPVPFAASLERVAKASSSAFLLCRPRPPAPFGVRLATPFFVVPPGSL